MSYSMHLFLTLATVLLNEPRAGGDEDPAEVPTPDLPEIAGPALQRLWDLVDDFRNQPVSPTRTHQFEQHLQDELRELGRGLVQWTYNHLEAAAVEALPKHVHFQASQYTRLNQKTAQNAWTLFGQIRLWRVGYRPTDKSGDPTLFPLALGLGLVEGASPALAGRAAQLLSDRGMTQNRTLGRLCQDHGVGWGVKKLRQVTAAVALGVAAQRHETQVEKLLALLGQAAASRGKHKPVLSVGRDGITLGL